MFREGRIYFMALNGSTIGQTSEVVNVLPETAVAGLGLLGFRRLVAGLYAGSVDSNLSIMGLRSLNIAVMSHVFWITR